MSAFNPFKPKDWEKLGGKAGKAGEDVFKQAKKEIEKVAADAKKDVQRTAERARKDVDGTVGNARRRVGAFTHEAEAAADAAAKGAESAIEAAEDAIPAITDQVYEAVKDALEEAFRNGTIDKIVDIAQYAVPEATVPLRLSVFELNVNIHSKIDVLQRLSHRLPEGREEILEMIKSLTDEDMIIIHVDAQFFSSALGFDIAIPIPISVLVEGGDEVFEHFGL